MNVFISWDSGRSLVLTVTATAVVIADLGGVNIVVANFGGVDVVVADFSGVIVFTTCCFILENIFKFKILYLKIQIYFYDLPILAALLNVSVHTVQPASSRSVVFEVGQYSLTSNRRHHRRAGRIDRRLAHIIVQSPRQW